MFTAPRFEHLLVNSALLLLVGLPLEMTHGCGRIALVFVPGPFLYYISQNGNGAQNADGRLPYLFGIQTLAPAFKSASTQAR